MSKKSIDVVTNVCMPDVLWSLTGVRQNVMHMKNMHQGAYVL